MVRVTPWDGVRGGVSLRGADLKLTALQSPGPARSGSASKLETPQQNTGLKPQDPGSSWLPSESGPVDQTGDPAGRVGAPLMSEVRVESAPWSAARSATLSRRVT